jgi:hypothetical protein
MATKLTDEQRNEIAASPRQAVPVVDAQSGKTYYVVDDEFLFGQLEQDEHVRQRLTALLEEGFASGEVSEEKAHARMRATIDEYRSRDASCD